MAPIRTFEAKGRDFAYSCMTTNEWTLFGGHEEEGIVAWDKRCKTNYSTLGASSAKLRATSANAFSSLSADEDYLVAGCHRGRIYFYDLKLEINKCALFQETSTIDGEQLPCKISQIRIGNESLFATLSNRVVEIGLSELKHYLNGDISKPTPNYRFRHSKICSSFSRGHDFWVTGGGGEIVIHDSKIARKETHFTCFEEAGLEKVCVMGDVIYVGDQGKLRIYQKA
jgi:hypothetical protein